MAKKDSTAAKPRQVKVPDRVTFVDQDGDEHEAIVIKAPKDGDVVDVEVMAKGQKGFGVTAVARDEAEKPAPGTWHFPR